MPKTVWGLLGVATLLLILGTGNLIIGSTRAAHYREVLNEIQHKVEGEEKAFATSDRQSSNGVSSNELRLKEIASSTEAQAHFNTIRQRFEYYQFCVIGAKYFLALSGCLYLAALVALRFVQKETLPEKRNAL
ncbi:MAG: hypothetical protein KDD70_13040 [Bdellovibrionales bacterium]|nr:hypothetical protein [Bdellovibrionales bacterium]